MYPLFPFNIAPVKVSYIATALLIQHFRQLLRARPVLGSEGAEPALPWVGVYVCGGVHSSQELGSHHPGDVS